MEWPGCARGVSIDKFAETCVIIDKLDKIGAEGVMKELGDKVSKQLSGHVRPRQGTEICNFGAPSPLEALHWIFCFFSSIYVQFSKTSPLKSGESSEKSRGENREKSCHVCGCHGFFGPEIVTNSIGH